MKQIAQLRKLFRPVSVLNTFSKIFEKIMKQQLVVHLDTTLSVFIGAYRKACGTQHVLIRLLEDWKTKLDNNYVVGAVLMDLSKSILLHPKRPPDCKIKCIWYR